ncbi:hypothetical protein LC724_32390 [Blautia sp. RD014234]|nr:hypothetical protein [Blautia parvula]
MKNLQDIVMLPFAIVAVLTVVVAGIRHSDFTKSILTSSPSTRRRRQTGLTASFQ